MWRQLAPVVGGAGSGSVAAAAPAPVVAAAAATAIGGGGGVGGSGERGRRWGGGNEEDPGRPRGVVTRICTGCGPP
jgi:hypothetical protein